MCRCPPSVPKSIFITRFFPLIFREQVHLFSSLKVWIQNGTHKSEWKIKWRATNAFSTHSCSITDKKWEVNREQILPQIKVFRLRFSSHCFLCVYPSFEALIPQIKWIAKHLFLLIIFYQLKSSNLKVFRHRFSQFYFYFSHLSLYVCYFFFHILVFIVITMKGSRDGKMVFPQQNMKRTTERLFDEYINLSRQWFLLSYPKSFQTMRSHANFIEFWPVLLRTKKLTTTKRTYKKRKTKDKKIWINVENNALKLISVSQATRCVSVSENELICEDEMRWD